MRYDNMKRNMRYMASLLSLALLFSGCEKIEPEHFDEGANGAYFDYEYATDFDQTLNFADHIVGSPDTVSLPLKVKLLGYFQEAARTLAVKTKPIEGYALADVTIDEVTFSGNEYEKTIDVKVRRPEVEDSTFAVCIYLDGTGDLGTGISGKDAVNLYVTEAYEMPSVWYSHASTFLGGWNKAKHIFLAQHTGDNYFYSRLYDEESGMHLYNDIIALNVSAVNALLASEPTGSIAADLPILKESDYPDYTEPYFWSQYEELLGGFRTAKFCRFTTMMGGATTRTIADLYASEEGQKKMGEEADNFHKDDVKWMLDEYYTYAEQGIALAEYKERCWVKMRNLDYTMRIPYWWEDPEGLGTASIVEKYFGEYGDYKYYWMLQTMIAEEGNEDFMVASILPFIKDDNSYAWDQSPIGPNQLSGEERLKECYRIIKAKYDGTKSTTIKNRIGTIPDVPLD